MNSRGSAAPQNASAGIDPMPILETLYGTCQSAVLAAAVELNLFTEVGRGNATPESLAQVTACSARGLRILMNALTRMGFLEKDDEHYSLSPVSAKFLSTDGPSYLGEFVRVHQGEVVRGSWFQLAQTVRSGKPPAFAPESMDQFFAKLVDPLYTLSAAAAEVAAKAIYGHPSRRKLKVLDIAAGSGVWSLALARHDAQTRVTVADSPIVIEKVTKRFAAREGVAEQYDYLPGDLREVDFGESAYDVAILGHICHGLGVEDNQKLFQRAHRLLKEGGQLLIAEIIPDDERREALFPLLFAVNMLALTPEGDTFTMSEYRQWLQEAGFKEINTIEAPSPSPLILARKS
jgi:3-hydroxy-5-methyl-1-naphthoate 3-O-methyltransferase